MTSTRTFSESPTETETDTPTSSVTPTGTATQTPTATAVFSATACAFTVYPNPYNVNTAFNRSLKFFCLPAGSRVRIYTTSLWMIRDLRQPVQGLLEWDGRNADGRIVAPAVYFYLVDFGDGRRSLQGTVSVVH